MYGKSKLNMFRKAGIVMHKDKNFFLWKIILSIASFVIIILSKSEINWDDFSKNYFDGVLAKEIIYDLSVGIFSAMILIWFIDEINERIQAKKQREERVLKIKRADRLLQPYIERYKLFLYCLITPIENRNFSDYEIQQDFLLKDMRDLYKTTLILSEGIFNTSIGCFIKAESELKDKIENMIMEVELLDYPELQESLVEFVETSLKYNEKDAWLKAQTTRLSGTQTLAEMAVDILQNNADDWYIEVQNGKTMNGNIVLTYFALYEMIKGEYAALSKYENEINKVN